jgi:hypothetical protein
MPDLFHNPYHFVPSLADASPGSIPLGKKGNSRQLPALSGHPHLTHDRFLAAKPSPDNAASRIYSGRLVCRLKVCELLAVGAQQTAGDKKKNKSRTVELFKLDGQWAIPGSSLRGLLSGLAEVASNSALRVLENKELSLSAGKNMTRKQLGCTYNFFQAVSPELLPLHFRDGRTHLSLAEQLFGVVELLPQGAKPPSDWRALALASRLRFSNALMNLPATQVAEGVTTQILDKPKPPSPSLYFRSKANANGAFIPKLSVDPQYHIPQGRKFYLHRSVLNLNNNDWKSADHSQQLHQKAIVRPLQGGDFWFHIDFDNLSQLELELLCYGLHPCVDFHHKLGMGKSLGLGKIKIYPVGIFLIHRVERYRPELLSVGSPRYHESWRDPKQQDFPHTYQREADAKITTQAPSPIELSQAYRQRIQKDHQALLPVLKAIQLLGNPSKVELPVHYPQLDVDPKSKTPIDLNSARFETQHFKWWVENEKQKGQFLRPLTAANTCGFTKLPALNRAPSKLPPSPSCLNAGVPPGLATAATSSKVSAKPVQEAVAAPAAGPVAPVPSSLINTKQLFTITEGKAKKDGTKQPLGLKLVWNNETFTGGMDFNQLVKKGLKPADTVELRITGYNPGLKSFNVSED